MVGDSVDHFRINDNRVKRNQIRYELANFPSSEQNAKALLLVKWDRVQAECDGHRVLVNLFVQAVANFVKHLEGATEDEPSFFFEDKLRSATAPQIGVFIRVHPC